MDLNGEVNIKWVRVDHMLLEVLVEILGNANILKIREGAKNTLRGGGAHNAAAFGRKCVLPPFFSSP